MMTMMLVSGQGCQTGRILYLHASAGRPSNCINSVSDQFKHCHVHNFMLSPPNRNPVFQGKSLTTHKTALVFIKDFRPFFARVPLGVGKGMSRLEGLALHVEKFDLKGCYEEDVWGSPKDIETNSSIRLWTEGLRQAGGGGNVLKLRKQALAEEHIANEETLAVLKDITISRPISPKAKTSMARKTAYSKPRSVSAMHPTAPAVANTEVSVDPRKVWQRSWRPFSYKPSKYALPPSDVLDALRQMPVDTGDGPDLPDQQTHSLDGELENNRVTNTSLTTPNKSAPKHRRNPLDMSSSPNPVALSISISSPRPKTSRNELLPATPSQWSPSIKGSPRRLCSPDLVLDSEITPDGTDAENTSIHDSGERTAGTPNTFSQKGEGIGVQEEKSGIGLVAEGPDSRSDPERVPPATASSNLSAPTPAQRPQPVGTSSPFPDTSFCIVSSITAATDSSKFVSSTALRPPSESFPSLQSRRVPLPVRSRLSPDPDLPGGRILVPNSDPSATASQSQARSQQSLSYASQSQPQSQQSLSYALQSQVPSHSQSPSQPESQYHRQEQSHPRNEVKAPSLINELPVSKGDADRNRDILEQLKPASESMGIELSQVDFKRHSPNDVVLKEHQGSNQQHEEEIVCVETGAVDVRPPAGHLLEQSKPTDDDSSETEAEDADDEGEVDELGSQSMSPQHGRSYHMGQVPELDGFDSDDARTKAMVDQYISRTNISLRTDMQEDISRSVTSVMDSGHKLVREDATGLCPTNASRSRRPTRLNCSFIRSEGSDGPLPPSSPDVFMSEESFHASQSNVQARLTRAQSDSSPKHAKSTARRVVASVKKPAASPGHDADAWRVPTFMRKEVQHIRQKAPATGLRSTRQAVTGHKRIISVSSSEEQPVPKKQKVSGQSLKLMDKSINRNTAIPHNSQAAVVPSTEGIVETSGNHQDPLINAEINHINLRRSVSTPSSHSSIVTKRKRSAEDARNKALPLISEHLDKTLSGSSTSSEIKHIDFRSARFSSTFLSRQAEQGVLQERGTVSRWGILPVTNRKKGSGQRAYLDSKVSEESNGNISASSKMTSAKAVMPSSHTGSADTSSSRVVRQSPGPMAEPRRDHRMQRSSRGERYADAEGSTPRQASVGIRVPSDNASMSRTVNDSTLAQTSSRLLGGYEVSFDMTREEGGAPLVTWEGLTQIVLRTGRARYQNKVQEGQVTTASRMRPR
ncbi:hypothetical protein AcW1_008896 [Taiwanofungus camphoratus]|nr:hypothetical protein AcW1_008896 [Antrodia cinnamomea]KAI0958964.1 hypothetical protein AcV7_004633 [Antrodia cinnamomea]